MASSGSGSGDGTRYIDPDLVYELYINRRSEDLVNYVNSFPGAVGDKRCNMIKQLVKSFLPYVITGRGHEHTEPYQHQQWADYARELAQECRFLAGGMNDFAYLAAPQMVGNLTNIASNPGHYMYPLNSSSYYGMMLTNQVPGSHVLRHSAMNQGSASSLRIPAATSTLMQANSNDGHYMNPFNSSSYAGRMPSSYMNPLDSSLYPNRISVVNDPLAHAAMLNQPSAPNSGIPAATPFPFRANLSDVSNYHPRYATMLNQTSASNTLFPVPMFLQANSNNVPAPAVGVHSLCQPGSEQVAPQEMMQNTVSPQELEQSNRGAAGILSLHQPGPEQFAPQVVMQNTVSPQELEQNNRSTPAVGVLSPRQPGSEHFVPQELMQNVQVMPTTDSKGKRPTSEIIQQGERMLRLSVASLIASDGSKGFAGVLIRVTEGQFISAACFPIPSMEPAFVFAAACCEAIKIAQVYQPTAVLLESHLFHLLRNVLQRPEVKVLKEMLRQVPHRLSQISEESNGAARQLAMRALQMAVPELFLEIPDWLALN